MDIPVASYVASNPEDPEGICGKMTYFTKETFLSLYGSFDAYLEQFKNYTMRQKEEGWIDGKSAEKMIAWSKKAIEKIV